jgi:hypothetical protein
MGVSVMTKVAIFQHLRNPTEFVSLVEITVRERCDFSHSVLEGRCGLWTFATASSIFLPENCAKSKDMEFTTPSVVRE